jgi:hypothetical protein
MKTLFRYYPRLLLVSHILCYAIQSIMASGLKLPLNQMQKLLQRVQSLNAPKSYTTKMVEFRIYDQLLGYCRPSFADILIRYEDTYMLNVEASQLRFVPTIEQLDVKGRTEAAQRVNLDLKRKGLITGWRDELLAVSTAFDDTPALLLERAACPFFGTKTYGVHINGYITQGGHLTHLWVGKRSSQKSTWPGMFDHIVAGALPAGITLSENVLKECAEEANIPSTLASQAIQSSLVSYTGVDDIGNLKRDVLFCYDLELPLDFVPQPVDGEVESFTLQPLTWVLDRLLGKGDEGDYKPNCNLVLIDFFLR